MQFSRNLTLLVASVLVIASQASIARAQAVSRFAANFLTSNEVFTTKSAASGGLKFYDNVVKTRPA